VKKRTIIATLALATMCSPAFAYSNVSPKEAPQKVNAINQSLRSVSTFDDVSPFWTINPGKDPARKARGSRRTPGPTFKQTKAPLPKSVAGLLRFCHARQS
jgi:hypothetical protein